MAYVIGIGGVRATGKSTLARAFAQNIRADIISCGRFREQIRAINNKFQPEQVPSEFFESILEAPSLKEAIHRLTAQAQFMKCAFMGNLRRSRENEVNLIFEGTQLVPGMYAEEFDLHVLLTTSRERIEYRMHKDKKRKKSPEVVQRYLEVQEYLISEAKKHNVHIIDSTSLPDACRKIWQYLPPDKELKTYFT